MAQLEYGDYYKFVVSCGIGLIVVSVGLPWLFLHEPFDLLLESSKLSGLTPLAREVVAHRQKLVGFILTLIPYASTVLATSGTAMTVYGLLRWRARQTVRDRSEEVALDKSREELRQMTREEVDEKVREEVLLEQPQLKSAAPSASTGAIDAAVASYLAVESTCLDAVERNLPAGYQLLRHQRTVYFEVDALIRSEEPAAPEYLIEFKTIGANTTARHMPDALRKISRAADLAGFGTGTSRIPMFLATGETIDAPWMEEALRFINGSSGNPTAIGRSLIRFVTSARIARLTTRNVRDILDTSQRLVVISDDSEG